MKESKREEKKERMSKRKRKKRRAKKRSKWKEKGRKDVLRLSISSSCPQVLETLLGEGIFNVDGPKWERQRKIASYMFSQAYLK